MRITACFLLIIVSFASQGQNKWNFGIMASPDITSVDGKGNFTKKAHLGFETGVSVYRKLSNSFYLNSGLTIANRTFEIIYHDFLQDANGQPIPGALVYNHYKWTDLNVPIIFNFRLPLSVKFSLIANAGSVLGWTIKNTVDEKTVIPDEEDQERRYTVNINRKGPERAYLSAGIGCMYKINKKLTIMVAPNFMIDILSTFYNTKSHNLRTTLLYNF